MNTTSLNFCMGLVGRLDGRHDQKFFFQIPLERAFYWSLHFSCTTIRLFSVAHVQNMFLSRQKTFEKEDDDDNDDYDDGGNE